MKQITLELMENRVRPIVKMDSVLKFEALLDTGAAIPIKIAFANDETT